MVGELVKRRALDKELEKIRRMQSINSVLNKGNMENLLLYTSSKEGEAVSDTVMEGMLNELEKDRNVDKNISVIENLVDENKNVIKKEKDYKVSGKAKPAISRKLHIAKKGNSKKAQIGKSKSKMPTNKKR